MKKKTTHTAKVIHPKTGVSKTVRCYETALSWVVGRHESYNKMNGRRSGSIYAGGMASMDLSTLKEIEVPDV